jgi:hypothetical protein
MVRELVLGLLSEADLGAEQSSSHARTGSNIEEGAAMLAAVNEAPFLWPLRAAACGLGSALKNACGTGRTRE